MISKKSGISEYDRSSVTIIISQLICLSLFIKNHGSNLKNFFVDYLFVWSGDLKVGRSICSTPTPSVELL
jgi:hypothetical protein